MPVRSRFVSIECLESRQLLSAAVAAVFDHAGIAPVTANATTATNANSTQPVITKALGTTPTTTNLALDANSTNPAAQGTSVTFDAIVSPTVPTGDLVEFLDNGTMIGQAPVVAGTGTSLATFSTSMLSLGSHPITAEFMGDATFAASTPSNIVTEVIGTGTTTTVSASSPVVAPGAPGVQFSAGVTPNTSGGPNESGTVTFTADGNNVLATVMINNGTAITPFITTLTAGTHSITATYNGDANYVMSTSAAPATVTVNTPTTTVLTDTLAGGGPVPAMITPGTTVNFTATVTPNPLGGPAINGDSVTFLNNGIAIGSAITANGVAMFSTSMLPNGPDNITASFPGDMTYRASVSAPKSITVAQVATTTSLTPLNQTVPLGGAAVFMAMVNPAPTTPGESVMFFEGANMLGSTPIINGTATFTDSSLPLGSHMIYAVYPGDAGNIASTSNTVTAIIGIATATSLAAFPSGSVTPGTQVNFTATVTQMPPTAPAPTGQVNFSDNGALIGSGVLMGGMATFSTAALPNGINNITATYAGDASNVSSTSMAQTITVGLATTLMVTSPNPTAALGSPVVLNVTVNPAVLGGPLPTGSVTFFDGNNPIMPNGTTPLVNGMASITVTTLPSGSNTITVSYTGDANYFPNHPAANVVIMVGAASGLNANLALKSSAPAAGLASLVTFTATVTGVGVTMPTGTVEFDDGGVMIGSGTLVNGVATFPTSTLPPGPNIITAIYSGDTSFNPAMGGPITVTIGAVPSTPTNTVLTSSAPSAALGNTLTFTAMVNPSVLGGPAPTGLVVFLNGTTFVGQAAVQPNGIAILMTGALPAGVDGITANYAGDISNGASVSNPVTETIGAAPGSTVNVQVVSTAIAIGIGGTVTITANVRPVVVGPVPTGFVTFLLNGNIILGSMPVQNIGTAVLTLNTLPPGADRISASYSGDTTYNPANSLAITINVGANVGILADSTDLTTSNASVNVGLPITFTATVTPKVNGGALPTGIVTFLSDGVAFGMANLVNGVAKLTTSSLPQGLNIITANYSGDANYAPSTSITINETVGTIPQSATFTSLVTSNPLVNIGDTAMLTATVTAADGTIPTGTVSFIEGTTTMGSAPLQPDGTATFSLPILMAGIDDIRATYDGALFYSASTSPVITETVGPALPGTTTTTLTGSTGLIAVGGSITFTATIVAAIPGGLTPTGAVTFFNGSTQLAVTPVQADGTAVFTTTALLAGIDNITATYGGDTVYTTSTSPAFSVAAGPIAPTYTTALDVSAGSAPVGGPVLFTATVTPSSTAAAPTGDVTFLSGTTVLGVAVVQGDGTAVLKTTSLPNGNSSITAVFSGATGVSGPSPVITEMVSSLPPSLDLPSVSGETVPTGGVVAGARTSIKLPVTITNTSMGISTGPFKLNIYLNIGATLDGHEILAGTGTKFLYLDPTASSKPWKVLLKSLPSTVPTGTYHIIIQSVDPNGSTASVTASETINVIAPFVNLAATVSAVTPASLHVGQNGSVTLTLTNNGNIDASGPLSIVLNLSADGISPLSVAGTILTTMTANHMVLKAHQTRTFRIHFKPTAVIPAASYFPFASISLASYSASAVGTMKFTLG